MNNVKSSPTSFEEHTQQIIQQELGNYVQYLLTFENVNLYYQFSSTILFSTYMYVDCRFT